MTVLVHDIRDKQVVAATSIDHSKVTMAGIQAEIYTNTRSQSLHTDQLSHKSEDVK